MTLNIFFFYVANRLSIIIFQFTNYLNNVA